MWLKRRWEQSESGGEAGSTCRNCGDLDEYTEYTENTENTENSPKYVVPRIAAVSYIWNRGSAIWNLKYMDGVPTTFKLLRWTGTEISLAWIRHPLLIQLNIVVLILKSAGLFSPLAENFLLLLHKLVLPLLRQLHLFTGSKPKHPHSSLVFILFSSAPASVLAICAAPAFVAPLLQCHVVVCDCRKWFEHIFYRLRLKQCNAPVGFSILNGLKTDSLMHSVELYKLRTCLCSARSAGEAENVSNYIRFYAQLSCHLWLNVSPQTQWCRQPCQWVACPIYRTSELSSILSTNCLNIW